MAKSDLRTAVLGCESVQGAAAQPRAEPAHRASFGNDSLYDAVSVLLDDPVRDLQTLQVFRQDMLGKTRLLLIEVHREELEAHRRAALERHQYVEQRIRVLSPRQADHDAIPLGNH